MARFFVGVGAQKAGTTWLHHQLQRHPEVGVPLTRKEIEYFTHRFPTVADKAGQSHQHFQRARRGLTELIEVADEGERRLRVERLVRTLEQIELGRRPIEEYRRYLRRNAGSQTLPVYGEISPRYSLLGEEAFREMRSGLRRPRLIFVLRDPIGRYWSGLRMLKKNRQVSQAQVERMFHTAFRDPDSGAMARSNYPRTIGVLDEVFAEDEVLYLFYEELFREESLATVARHLGVATTWDWDLGLQANVGDAEPLPPTPPEMLDAFRPWYRYLRDRFGDRVPATWTDVDD